VGGGAAGNDVASLGVNRIGIGETDQTIAGKLVEQNSDAGDPDAARLKQRWRSRPGAAASGFIIESK